MGKQLVLVTGSTGHVGFRTLVQVLLSGYRARITVRKIAQVEKIKATKSIQPFLADLEYEEVPDITAPGAFDKAVQGVDFILHLASPITDTTVDDKVDVKKAFLQPAVDGTLSILRSAANSKTIKRVVATSSIAILAPPTVAGEKISPDIVRPTPNPDEVEPDPFSAYRASKILAYTSAQDWIAQAKPAWDLIFVLPAFVIGKNELVTDAQGARGGSNNVITDLVSGVKQNKAHPTPLVYVNDVAKLEVAALDTSKGKTGDRYIAAYPEKVTWDGVLQSAKKQFPDAFKKGILSEGHADDLVMVFDSSSSTKTFGIEFAGVDTMVQSQIGFFVDLKSKE